MRKFKTILIIASFLLAAGVTGAVFARRGGEGKPTSAGGGMAINVKVKPVTTQDFREEGIALRHLGDPVNIREAEYLIQSPPELRETANRYSFAIENTSSKSIIALSVAYSFLKGGQKGREADRQYGTVRSNAIQARTMGSANNVLLRPGMKVAYCLALGHENLNFENGIRYIRPASPPHAQMSAAQFEQRNQAVESQLAMFERMLAEAEGLAVEVEGCVFDDGSFVGTNRRHFFEQMNAKVMGAIELATELAAMADRGMAFADIVRHARTFTVKDMRELLAPFGGDVQAAHEDDAYQARSAKHFVAARFVSLPEPRAMTFLRKGLQNWTPLTKK